MGTLCSKIKSKAIDVASSISYKARAIFIKAGIRKVNIHNQITKGNLMFNNMKQVYKKGPVQDLRDLIEHAHSHISHHLSCMSCHWEKKKKHTTLCKSHKLSLCVLCIIPLYIHKKVHSSIIQNIHKSGDPCQ